MKSLNNESLMVCVFTCTHTIYWKDGVKMIVLIDAKFGCDWFWYQIVKRRRCQVSDNIKIETVMKTNISIVDYGMDKYVI